MEAKVRTEELEYEEEWIDGIEVEYATYNGAAFTGIETNGTDLWYSETKYLNGYAHGRSFAVFTNGRLCEESFMEHGITLEETRWYKSGAKREYYKKDSMINQYWREDGILLEEKNNETHKIYYPSGKLKSLFIGKDEKTYYDESGEWVVKIKAEHHDYVVTDRKNMTFNDDFISKNYMELLQDYDFFMYFIIWLKDKSDDERGDIVIDMIKSDVPWHKSEGINLAEKYNVRRAVPCICFEVDNTIIPPAHRNQRDILPRKSYSWTIGKTAKTVLERMGI